MSRVKGRNTGPELIVRRFLHAHGFRYRLRGQLRGDTLDAGLLFQDPVFLSDFGYLDGKCATLEVDRIDVAFI